MVAFEGYRVINPYNPLFFIQTTLRILIKTCLYYILFCLRIHVLYDAVGYLKDGDIVTITEEKDGWGKLADGRGWIGLKYTKEV